MRAASGIAALILATAGAGCGQPAVDAAATGLSGPFVVEMNPSGRAPLAGIARFTTDVPMRATILVTDDAGRSFTAPIDDEPQTEHEIVLLGFRPNRPHTLTLTLEDASGNAVEAATHTLVTPELPKEAAPIDVRIASKERMEPGYTLIPLFRWIGGSTDPNYSQIFVIDADGEIVWFYQAPHGFYEVKLLENGNLLYLKDFTMAEIDWLGNEVTNWHPSGTVRNAPADSIAIDVDTFHHDVLEMPSGNLLGLTTEVREIEDWYTSETDPDAPRATRNVIGDVLYEAERAGTVVNEWKFFDLIDPYRIGFGSTNTNFYAQSYDGILEEPAPDWTHNNGIDYDPATHTVLISSNHLSTVMNLDLASGELLWILGDPRGWREPWSSLVLEPGDENMIWSYHHHAPKWSPEGTLLLFDNGAVRARPFVDTPLTAEETFSRAVEYEIDAVNGTVREVWSYGGPDDEKFLSAYISDIDWLPETGNILVTKGGRIRDWDGNVLMFPEEGHNWITITEVTHTMPAEKVWEVVIDDPRWGMAAFRAERIPSLYP